MKTSDTRNPFLELFKGLDEDPDSLAMEFAERFDREIHGAMAQAGINRKQLAAKMGISPARMTRILSGEANLTIKTMVSIALALGHKVTPCLAPIAARPKAVRKTSSVAEDT